MTTSTAAAVRPTLQGRADGSRPAKQEPGRVSRVVAAGAVVGSAAIALTGSVAPPVGADAPMLVLGWLHGWALVCVLAALTCIAELVAVPVRHDDEVEELTLIDAMVLVNVLLLPVREALAVSLSGLLLAYAVRRRSLLKVVFNLGTYATGATVMIFLVRATAGAEAHMDGRLFLAMTLGTAGFVAVNLLSMSLLLSTMGTARPIQTLTQDIRLSLLTVVGTVALVGTALAVGVHSPAFLPCVVLPAAAMTYAYRTTAAEAEERQRSARVLAFSQVLASSPGRDAASSAFLRLARDEFAADDVLVILDSGTVLGLAAGDAAPRLLPLTRAESALLRSSMDGARLVHDGLPAGWGSAMVAPLLAGGAYVGAIAVGVRSGGRLRARHITAITPLASALAVALESAEHLELLEEETSKLRAVVDQSSDGILVLDGTGVVQLWNPALTSLTGHVEEQALGAPLGALLAAETLDGVAVDAFAAAREALSPEASQAALDLVIIRRDGERRSVRCAHAAVFQGSQMVRDVVILHDLTAERQAERLKTDFVATVSHELRTPLTPIKGYADMLRKRGDRMTPEKRAQALGVIADRAAHLGRLVEDLLLASSINGDREPQRAILPGTADLGTLVTRALEDFVTSSPRLDVQAAESPIEVSCDHVRAVQILTNLVSNALKYSPEGTRVEVLVDDCDGYGRVLVRDHGRGIPVDQVDRVFDKFHRVEDPMLMSTSGTGLGLYIARHLARAMGGDIAVESALGVGSEFTVTLPLAEVPEQGHPWKSPEGLPPAR